MTDTQQVLSALLNSKMEESTKESLKSFFCYQLSDEDIERIGKIPLTCENCGRLLHRKGDEMVCKNQDESWHNL
jgi:hypothetical protein